MQLIDGKRNSPIFFFLFCITPKCCVCPPFVTWQNSRRYSIFAHTRCSISRSVSEKAAMILLRRSGGTSGTGGRKTEALIFLYKKKNDRMAWGQVILVASEAAPRLLQRAWATGLTSAALERVDTQSIIEVWGMQNKNLELLSLYQYVACYNPSRHSSVPILWKCEPEHTWTGSVRELHHNVDHFYTTILQTHF
jgi:hypothetical protein